MSSHIVYIIDEEWDTRDRVDDFSDPRDAERKAQEVRDQLEEDGDTGFRVEVVEHNEA